MAWALWLAVPVGVTAVVAIWVWWFGRPARTPDTAQAMRQHQRYLDALVVPARGSSRPQDATGMSSDAHLGADRPPDVLG